MAVCLPLAITVAAGLRVNDVESRLTGEVLEVLYPDPSKLMSMERWRDCVATSLAV